MSCLCPISIPDKIALEYGIKGASLVVPCGHCAGCAKDKRNDWFVRIWSTYQRCVSLHVPVWFITVTIDPDLWPRMTVDSPGVGSRVTGFVRSWTERFRYLNGGKLPLRFLCSEFGELGKVYVDYHGRTRISTGALHFHGLIFGHIPIKKLREGFARSHGHVDFDLIRGPEGIRYTVKYATKDFSIEDPLLRARVFCSPGIGDSTYYFGSSAPSRFVLINGFHYRTPRYFLDKQWILFYGGKCNYFLPDGHSILVRENFERRLSDYRFATSVLDSSCDPSFRSFFCSKLYSESVKPATLESVIKLKQLGLTGCSHPLLRYFERVRFDKCSLINLESDRSFVEREYLSCLPFNSFNYYERNQTFLPLSCNFAT